MKRIIGMLAVLLASAAVANAHVVRVEILQTTPVATPRGAESVGPYEQITGKIHGELDPNDPRNAIITDIKLAPRNARGKVEYVATFTLVKPVDMTKSSGVLRYTVVNRGGGQAVPSPDGHVTLVSGWQGDIVPTATNQTMTVPVARNADGTSITGPLVLRFTSRFVNQAGNTIPLTIPREQPAYPPATLDTKQATLIAITSQSATGVRHASTIVPSTDWAFADCGAVAFPGKPDPTRLCLKNGFKPETVYELRYTAKDPLVLGIGLAATRDINSFFRYEKQDATGTPNPVAGRLNWAISEGSSQSGTFLKLMIMLGFNQDEAARKVWDGVNPNIAGRNTDLNRRFALPGGNVMLYELGHEAPSWWGEWNDTVRGYGMASVLDRCRRTNTCPKILETFGSAEIWGLRQSYSLVGSTAKEDIAPPDIVRRYYFAGVAHGGGAGGFSVTTQAVTTSLGRCDLMSNPAPSAPMRSALLKSFTDWVTKGIAMPPSKYPTVADGTLVPPTSAAMGFPKIPGRPLPDGVLHPLLDYDVGPEFNYRDQSGVASQSPEIKGVLPQLVPRVDADGNEVAGIKSPLQMAPLGTYTGWNVISSGMFKGQLCNNNGTGVAGYIPFVVTRAERLASGDPRLSLEERYQTHEGYVKAVTDAANALLKQGYLLRADAEAMIAQASASTVLR
jgi:alpha/beta hydrolase family protein